MPAARDSLLDAAYTAVARRPWAAVRMVDVAAAAGVSRQTLYNEFGSKEGLARALVRREADGFLAGVERALAAHAGPRERLTAVAEWTASAARENALVRAMLTGCWSERLPSPTLSAVPSSSAVPAQRRADGPLPSPADFVMIVRDRAVAVLSAPSAVPGQAAPSGPAARGGPGGPAVPSGVGAPPGATAQLGQGALPGRTVPPGPSATAQTGAPGPGATAQPEPVALPGQTAQYGPGAPPAPAVPRAPGAPPAPAVPHAPGAPPAPTVQHGPGAPLPAAVSQADPVELSRTCELVVRLALSCVAAPPGEGIAELVRATLHRHRL